MSYRRLAIAINTKCNLSCAWCYRFDSEHKDIIDKEMSVETFKQIIDNTKSRFRMIHLAGSGEPTMHPDLMEIITIARQKTDHVKITTNGTFLTKEMVINLEKAGLTHLEMSIDSFKELELKELRGSILTQLVERLKYVNDYSNLHLQVNSVVSNLNCEGLFDIVDVLKEIDNLKIFHTIPLFKTEQFQGTAADRLTPTMYKSLLQKIEADIEEAGLKWELFPNSTGVNVDPVMEMKKQNNICFTCFEDPYISINGYIPSCARREFGDLDDARNGFEEAMNGPKISKFRKNMLKGHYPSYCGTTCFLDEKAVDARKTDEEKLVKDNPMRKVVDDIITDRKLVKESESKIARYNHGITL